MSEEKVFEKMEKAYHEKATGYSDSLRSDVKEVYGPEDIRDLDFLRDVGKPGEYPFTRGIHPNMYRGKLWTMRTLVGFGTAEESRERVKRMAELGTTGINIIPDGPTLCGLDPDHPLAEGEIGVVGMSLPTLKDMEIFLEGIPIEKISSSVVVTTCVSPIIFAQFLAVAEMRGLDIARLRGTIQNNPIKDFYCSHQLGSSHLDLCLKTCGDIYEYCVKHMPKWNPTNVNMASFVPYGLTAAQDLGIAFAIALAEIGELLGRGLDIDDVAPRMGFFCANDMNLLEQVAKFRGARRIWARLMREKYNAKNPNSWLFRFGAFTSGYTLYPQEILNNIIRLTIEALSLVLGGVQSLFVAAYDEPIALPTEQSMRLSLRIQQIIAHESGIANTADPLGGSYYIEWLTNKIEEDTKKFIDALSSYGGIASAKGSKWLKGVLENSSWEHQQNVNSGRLVKVGVNAFTSPDEEEVVSEIHRTPLGTAATQMERLREVKAGRDNGKVKKDLAKLYEMAKNKNGVNLMPFVLQAVKDYATVGEIFGTIREAYGYPYDPASEAGTLF